MKIGDLAKHTGLSVVTLRFYETQGLLESQRTDSNYRDFPASALERVRQIKNFRALKLSIPEMKQLLKWSLTPSECCGEVCELVEIQLQRVVEQRAMLEELEVELRRLLSICSGKGEGGCNILRELSTGRSAAN
jgi:DNA-binding transcriptional MerR regulator